MNGNRQDRNVSQSNMDKISSLLQQAYALSKSENKASQCFIIGMALQEMDESVITYFRNKTFAEISD